MRVMFVIHKTDPAFGRLEFPFIGILYLGAVLKRAGFEVRVLDARLKSQDIDRTIREFEPSVVGFSSTTYGFHVAAQMASHIKEHHPGVVTVAGGVHPTLVPEEVLDTKAFDFVIRHEGEVSFLKLCKALRDKNDWSDIYGIGYRANGSSVTNPPEPLNQELDGLPFPDYSLLELKKYTPSFPMVTSRGCPFLCTYCGVHQHMGNAFRSRSPENVIEEIIWLQRNFNMKRLCIVDDNFIVDVKRCHRILDLMKENKINLKWQVGQGVRPHTITYDLAVRMKEAGCTAIGMGIESTDPAVLKDMKRGGSMDAVDRAIRDCQRAGIEVKAYFLIGSPGETIEHTLANIEYAKKMGISSPRFSLLTPYPGSELYEYVTKNDYWNKLYDPYLATHAVHSERTAPVPFSTPEFSLEDRARAYQIVLDEVDTYTMDRWFRRKMRFLGPGVNIFTYWLRFRSVRNLLKKGYFNLGRHVFSIHD